ncbi:SHOCT domain-containing protein [Actinoplanes siamensis]|nr:SHOCT domain-containing protein [Actinoplanes siamensis]
MARTAVIAGTATAVSNRVSRRQAGRWALQDAEDEYYARQQHAPEEPDQMSAKLAKLRQLGELRSQGLLTDAEVETQKAKILNS